MSTRTNAMKLGTLCTLALLAVPAHAHAQDHPYETDVQRAPSFATGGSCLIRGATIHTAVGPAFVGDVLVKDGKIAAIGEVDAPDGILVLDGTGKHLAPGVVDCHSHMAIEQGINEGTVSISAEVTIADSVNPDDVGIYRALGGGWQAQQQTAEAGEGTDAPPDSEAKG